LPDASTPIGRTLASYPRAARRHATLHSPERDGELPPARVPAGAPPLPRRSVTVDKNATPGEILIMAGAGVALIFSFLPFYKIEILNTSDSTSACVAVLFPVAMLIPFFAAIAGVMVVFVRF